MKEKEFLLYAIDHYTDEEILRAMCQTLLLVPIGKLCELNEFQLETILARLRFLFGDRMLYPDEKVDMNNVSVNKSDDAITVTFVHNGATYICKYEKPFCRFSFTKDGETSEANLFLGEQNFVKSLIADLTREKSIV